MFAARHVYSSLSFCVYHNENDTLFLSGRIAQNPTFSSLCKTGMDE